ncbi:MAG TPA: DNRLRE domain-containing protein [Candidatus Eisenbacteria bacterium]
MNRPGALATAALVVMMGMATGGRAAVVRIPASHDNTLYAPAADTLSSNGSGPYLFAGRNGQGNVRRALLFFPVADSLPAGAIIDSVELRFTVSQVSNATPRSLLVRRVLASWGEGGSSAPGGAGARPEPGDATWQHRFFPGDEWTNPGGDLAPLPSAASDPGVAGLHVLEGPGLVADVAGWLDAGINAGWAVLGDEFEDNSARRINSRENAGSDTRPELVVIYRLPGSPIRAATWSRIKTHL